MPIINSKKRSNGWEKELCVSEMSAAQQEEGGVIGEHKG